MCSKYENTELMTDLEIITAARAAAQLGIKKVRITGGEPLVRHNIIYICRVIAGVAGIEELCMTTNGIGLSRYASRLRDAGVDRVNVSLDTLNDDKYRRISGAGSPKEVLRGVETALDAGFKKVKLNTVLLKGINDDEIMALAGLTQRYPIDVRFIEYMPMPTGRTEQEVRLSCDYVLETLKESRLLDGDEAEYDGVARLYRLKGALGSVGVIAPVSRAFCSSCSRLRLSADGRLKPCLHSQREISVKGLTLAKMKERFREAVEMKPESHDGLKRMASLEERPMNTIGG